MKNLDQRNKIIEYSLKLNSTNLSPLRSGNISLRTNEDDKDGYLIMQEFGHLIQMHTDQALRRGQKHLHEDMHEDFIHPSWRDDL